MRRTSATGSCADAACPGCPDRAKVSRRGGYTLLELMVVLAILGLMVGLFPLAIGRALPARRVSATAQSLVAWVSEAQAESVASGTLLHLSLEGHALHAQRSSGAGHLAPMSWSDSTVVTLRAGDGSARKRFDVYPDGSTDGADLGVADGTHHAHVRVSALTGRITTDGLP